MDGRVLKEIFKEDLKSAKKKARTKIKRNWKNIRYGIRKFLLYTIFIKARNYRFLDGRKKMVKAVCEGHEECKR